MQIAKLYRTLGFSCAFAGVNLAVIAWLLVRIHTSAAPYQGAGAGPDIAAQLAWVSAQLRAGAGEATQAWYPEGYFFPHVLYGLARVNEALLSPDDAALAARNAAEVEWALTRLESAAGRAPFPRAQAVPYGVFYTGWHNRLLGGLLLLQPEAARDPARVAQFHAQSAQLAEAFAQSPSLYLEAYPGGCWPVDNVVALSSLRLHDQLYGTHYGQTVDAWSVSARAHLDPATGLLPHRIHMEDGTLVDGARGSSLVLALTFLPEVDATLAREQYALFRAQYAQPLLGFVLTREYPQGSDGYADVDSGPLVFGLSPVATGVSLAASRANGDAEWFERMVQLSETLGFPSTVDGQKRYAGGQLVVGDAFLAWGKSVLPWSVPGAAPAVQAYARLTPTLHWYAYAIALVWAALACLPLVRVGRAWRNGG